MNSLSHNQEKDVRWGVYRELELIPNSVVGHPRRTYFLLLGLSILWRKLLALLIDELVEEQRVEYLDRCWSLNASGRGGQSPPNPLHRLWILMN